MIYFDSAATSFQKPSCVSAAVSEAMRRYSSPGRGGYKSAMGAAELLLDCRTELAEMFSAQSPENVIFCSNATHALNIAVHSLVKAGDKVVVSGFEHNAVVRPLYAAGASVVVLKSILFDNESLLEALEQNISGASSVFITHVSNVFGYVLPIEKIAELCSQNSVPLVIDASQSAGVFPFNFSDLGAAFCAMPGHKGLLGPQGTGVLLVNSNTIPLLYGGTGSASISKYMPDFLPDRLEAGTHNIPGIAGLLAGIRWIKEYGEEYISSREKYLLRLFYNHLSTNPKIHSYIASDPEKQAGVLSLRLQNCDAEAAAGILSEHGIAVRAGLHCAPLAHQTVGTLNSGTLRFSFSPFNHEDEIIYAAEILSKIAG